MTKPIALLFFGTSDMSNGDFSPVLLITIRFLLLSLDLGVNGTWGFFWLKLSCTWISAPGIVPWACIIHTRLEKCSPTSLCKHVVLDDILYCHNGLPFRLSVKSSILPPIRICWAESFLYPGTKMYALGISAGGWWVRACGVVFCVVYLFWVLLRCFFFFSFVVTCSFLVCNSLSY